MRFFTAGLPDGDRSARCTYIFSKHRRLIVSLLIFCLQIISILQFLHVGQVYAQPTPLPAFNAPPNRTADWQFSPTVTEVGKNADRARQLLWWVFQHPGIHSAAVIAQLWGVSRNIVFVFVVLVIVAFGLSLILGRRRGAMGPTFSGISSPLFGVNVPSIFFKIAMILVYVTFSYVVIVALVQISEIVMRFFIENVGGKDLFNVIFAGSGNIEANYINFVGYYDRNLLNAEMVNNSIFMVQLTSFTYYVMAIILILRTIILWFLLIIAPFLALLMPFVFIRNTGWIWIGVFFQWLFYGPLFALFLASLTRIWVAGIPYGFDFSRINKPQGQVYQTAINILWGGPAQVLSPGNSANYVDTFAEYVIALVMLWTAIILPWLLLRIFRDYCCAMIAASQSTLSSIFDRLRQYPVPPPSTPVGPVTTTGRAVELPFRQKVTEKIREVERTRFEQLKDVSRVETREIAKSMDISVSKLSDVSRLETNDLRRSEIRETFDRISNPERISSTAERERYMQVREVLSNRASQGDRIAQTLLAASQRKSDTLVKQVSQVSYARPVVATIREKSEYETSRERLASFSSSQIEKISKETGVSTREVRDVIRSASIKDVSSKEKIKEVSQKTGVSESKVREVIASSAVSSTVSDVAQKSNVSDSAVREILKSVSQSELSDREKLREVSQKTGVSESSIREIVSTAASSVQVQTISKQTGVSTSKVSEVLNSVSVSEISSSEKVKEVAQKTGVSESSIREIVSSSASASTVQSISKETGVSTSKVSEILSSVSVSQLSDTQKVKEVAEKTGVSESTIREIVSSSTSASTVQNISKETGISESKVSEVLNSVSVSEIKSSEKVKEVSQKTGISEDSIREIVSTAAAPAQVQSISKETGVSTAKVSEILSSVSVSQLTDTQKISEVSQKTGVSESTIKEIVSAAAAPAQVQTIAKETGISTTKVSEILSSVSVSQLSDFQRVKEVSEKTGVSEEKVKEIVSATSVTTATMQSISERTGVSQEKVREILESVSVSDISNVENVQNISQKTGLTEIKVREVFSAVTSSTVISAISSQSHTEESKVKEVLSSISQSDLTNSEKINYVAQKTGLEASKVTEIVQSVNQPAIAQSIAAQAGVSPNEVKEVLSSVTNEQITSSAKVEEVVKQTGVEESKVKDLVATSTQVVEAAPEVAIPSTVSVEDYEEVKQMWLKHYRSAPVPVSESIKTREQWLKEEEKKLTNINNLLASANPQMREKGLEKVAEILPFMLLGGFSDAEIRTYIRAKMEADKQVQSETEVETKVKAEVELKLKQQKEEEETLLEVPLGKAEAAAAEGILAEKLKTPEEKAEEKGKKDEDKIPGPEGEKDKDIKKEDALEEKQQDQTQMPEKEQENTEKNSEAPDLKDLGSKDKVS